MDTAGNIARIESQIKSDPFNPAPHIALAKAYLDQGDEERARMVIAIKRKLPSQDPSVHFEWAKLCEQLGMSRQARESYEQAIALNPQDAEFHFKLGVLLYEKGAWERALKHLQKTISLSPQNEEAKGMLASLYEELGFPGSARVLRRMEKRTSPLPQTTVPELTIQEVSVFLDLLKGREVGYARYHFINTGNLVHAYVNRVFGSDEIMQHVKGDETYGIFPLRSDQTLKFSLIRARVPWRRIVTKIKDSGFLAITEDNVHQYASGMVERIRDYGFSAYLERPGRYERRVWFFFEEFVPMGLGERFLKAILEKVPAPGLDISVNPVLGFKGTGLGRQDNPVMLPLGINRRAGIRCYFLDANGYPYENQMELLQKIRTVPSDDVRRFLKFDGGQFKETHRKAQESLKKLEERCSVLDEIFRKARSGRNLRDEEKRALYFTVGFLENGTALLNDVLQDCPDYRPKRVDRMASRLGSHPVSCPKIRATLPEITAYVRCDCKFKMTRPGVYPSPLLHIDPFLVPQGRNPAEIPITHEELKEEYRRLSDDIELLMKKREELGHRLLEECGEVPENEIREE
jgi:hypothetical protein